MNAQQSAVQAFIRKVTAVTWTHEHYIQAVRDAAVKYAGQQIAANPKWVKPEFAPLVEGLLKRLETVKAAKLVYGLGASGLRGITCFSAWKQEKDQELIEICAGGEESWIQLAGTTIHECGHVLAGPGAGHGPLWKLACEILGLRRIKAAGTEYKLANLAPALRMTLAALPHPTDGRPAGHSVSHQGVLQGAVALRPCSHGVGSRGGKSRGVGSGSRLRKFVCDCGVIVRASRDELNATCNDCGSGFNRE